MHVPNFFYCFVLFFIISLFWIKKTESSHINNINNHIENFCLLYHGKDLETTDSIASDTEKMNDFE